MKMKIYTAVISRTLFPIGYMIIMPLLPIQESYVSKWRTSTKPKNKGPLNFNFDIPWTENITFVTNPNRWTRISNIIFVDLPVGSGFSYGKTWKATSCRDSLLVSQSYEFLRKWLADHPRFYSNPLYIAGTSYMGIITPIVTWQIYEDNEREIQPELNIKGYLIISPLTDKFSDFNSRIEYAHRVALLSDDIYESAKKNCQGNYIDVHPSNTLCLNSLQRVDECISKINVEQILEPLCNFSAPDPGPTCSISNIIFVDLPVGSGFSYGKTWEATRCNDSLLVSQSYEFLRKWLVDHPRFYSNPLYIAGTSYMGLMTPIVTWEIYQDNERGIQPELNIKGYLITSPLTNKFFDFNSRIEYAHRVALISDDIYESAKENCQGNYIDVRPSNTLCVNSLQRVDECISKINIEQILEPVCNFSAPDPGPACSEYIYDYINHWANDKTVQKALNVREGTIGTWNYKNLSIHYDQKKEDTEAYSYNIFSSLSYHQKLVSKNCRVLIMNADHDMTFPYVGTEKWIKNDLNVTISSPWEPWFVRDQIAGYQMTYTNDKYSLKYTTCKGAGHSIPVYKPEETCVMVLSWLDSFSYSSDS